MTYAPPHLGQRSSLKCGFNLIEAAIGLSIASLVIGAIWSASAQMIERYKATKSSEDILFISQCITKNFPRMPYDSATFGGGTDSRWLAMQFFENVGCIPKSISRSSGSPPQYSNPYGGSFWVGMLNYGTGLSRLAIVVDSYVAGESKMSVGQCAAFLSRFLILAGQQEWYGFQISPTAYYNPFYQVAFSVNNTSYTYLLSLCNANPNSGISINFPTR